MEVLDQVNHFSPDQTNNRILESMLGSSQAARIASETGTRLEIETDVVWAEAKAMWQTLIERNGILPDSAELRATLSAFARAFEQMRPGLENWNIAWVMNGCPSREEPEKWSRYSSQLEQLKRLQAELN